MKKIYVLIVVSLLVAYTGFGQNRYVWTGAADNSWTNSGNWLLNGAASATTPSLATDSAIFNTGATVSLTLDDAIDLASLVVTNNTSAKITGGVNAMITVHSTNAAKPALAVDAGSKLEDDAVAGALFFFNFASGSQGAVKGEWIFSGNADDAVEAYSSYQFLDGTARLTVYGGGKLTVAPNGALFPSDNPNFDNSDLVLLANSTIDNQSRYPNIPAANYDPASTVIISGVIDAGPAMDEPDAIGSLIYNCASQDRLIGLSLLNNFNIKGSLTIQNTGGQVLKLVSYSQVTPDPTANVGIGGNLTISGNSQVTVAAAANENISMTLNIQGDLNVGGTSFDIQSGSVVQPTNLVVKGNLNHTAGTFGASSGAINENLSLFNIEFNGSTTQTLASTGVIDNAGHQISIRMNNALGLTLTTPVQVGRVDFSGPNHGLINTTAANVLTIGNTSNNAHVIYQPSDNGYISGPVARMTASSDDIVFPTGLAGTLRPVTIHPADNAANTFQAGLVSGNNGGGTVAPVAGLAAYYWNIARSSGASAATVAMPLIGTISGPAPTTDTLLPVAYDGALWHDARGNYIKADQTSGTLITASQPNFIAFTIGYTSASTLPIKLLSFTGRKVQNSAELAWVITDNSTPAQFEVVKSTDGVHFSSLGAQPGIEGKLNYTFTDNSIAAGNNFYRLKMFDKDGTLSYSNIIVVMNGTKGVMISSMIPTIVRDRARLNISSSISGNMQLVVTDISGRIVRHQVVSVTPGNQEVWLDASSLQAGMFQVTGYINSERTATFRFIKQ